MGRQRSKSVLQAIKEMIVNDEEAYFILWRYAKELLPDKNIKTYKDLQEHYVKMQGKTEESYELCLYKDEVQQAIKYLLKAMDTKRDVDLLNKYYKLAMDGDTQALKAYLDFKKNFFANSDTNELTKILKGVKIEDTSNNGDDDDFEMII